METFLSRISGWELPLNLSAFKPVAKGRIKRTNKKSNLKLKPLWEEMMFSLSR